MRIVLKLISFVMVFLLGFASCAGALVGVGYLAYKNVTLSSFNVDTSKFHDEEAAEVSLNYLTIEDIVEEVKTLHSLEDTLTFDTLVMRYGLIVSDEIDEYLPEDLRSIPLKKLFSSEGLDRLASDIYVGYFFGFEPVESNDPAHKYIWTDHTGHEVSGLNGNISNYTVKDFMKGGLDVHKLLEGLTIGSVLGMSERNDLPVHLLEEDGDEILVTDIPPISVWYDDKGEYAGSMMNKIAAMTIDDFDASLDELTISELMGYVDYKGVHYTTSVANDGAGEYVLLTSDTGIEAELADVTIATITGGGLDDELMNITMSVALGYKQGEDGKWYDGDREVTGVMAVFADKGYTIGELDERIDELKIGEVAGLYEIDGEWYSEVDEENPENNVVATGILASLADLTVEQMTDEGELNKKVKTITVADALGYTNYNDEWYSEFYGPYDVKNVKVTGPMKVLADKQIDSIQETINTAETGELLGYTKKTVEVLDENGNVMVDGEGNPITEEKWFDDNDQPVHVIMQKVASSRFDELGTLNEELELGDVIPPEKRDGLVSFIPADTKIDDIPEAVDEAFNTKTLRQLVEADVVLFEDTVDENGEIIVSGEQKKERFLEPDNEVADFTMPALMDFLLNLS